MGLTYKNKNTPPTTRIRLVVFDHATTIVDDVVTHISSTVIPPFGDDMIIILDVDFDFAAMGSESF